MDHHQKCDKGNAPIIGMFGFAVSAVLGVIILIDDHWQRRKFLKERARRKLDAKREKRNE